MVDIRIEGRVLDVFEGVDFSFNYSIADVRDPNKRNTEYSKTIKCPSTPSNDRLFGQIYDVNISNEYNSSIANVEVNFNPNKKASAVVMSDGVQIMNGVVQLRQITVNQSKMIYEVVFIGKLIDIFSLLGDKELNGLNDDGTPYIDFSDLDHQYDYGRITSSWTNTTGYVYPLIDYGTNPADYNSSGFRIYQTTDFRPAVYLHDIVDRIFNFVSFSFSSNFLESSPFTNLIVPWTNEGFTLTENEVSDREVVAFTQSDVNIMTTIAPNYPSGPFDYDFKVGFEAPVDPNSIWNDTTNEFIAPNDGFYTHLVTMRYESIRTALGGSVGNLPVIVTIYKRNAITGAITPIASQTHPAALAATNTIGATQQSAFSTTAQSIYLNVGDAVYAEVSVDQVPFEVAIQQHDVSILLDSSFNVTVASVAIVEGQNIPMNILTPNVGMADLLLTIFKMFNLYVTVDPNNDNRLIIETWDEFYGGGTNRDWTYKLARDKDTTIEPLALLTNKVYNYTYTEDEDYYNSRYQDSYSNAYGNLKAEIDNDFIRSENEIKIEFSPTPLVNDNPSNRLIGKIFDSDIENGSANTEHNMRVLYYGGLLDSDPEWIFKYYQQGQGFISVSQTKYPYAGHWDNPITPTLDINFGLPRELFYAGNAYTGTVTITNAGLFNVYHRNYFEEITNKDSKLLTGYFNLSPIDINQLDFRDQIIIDNSYWRLNKVMNYNPFKDGLTKVELIKVIDVTPFVVESKSIGSGGTITNGVDIIKRPFTGKVRRGSNTGAEFLGSVQGYNNIISDSVSEYFVQGNNNVIGEGSTNITIIGNDNFVQSGLHNVTIINTNGASVTQSNTTYVNNVEQSGSKIIEGGLNEVRSLSASNPILIVDGGADIVSNTFSQTGINIVDGGLD